MDATSFAIVAGSIRRNGKSIASSGVTSVRKVDSGTVMIPGVKMHRQIRRGMIVKEVTNDDECFLEGDVIHDTGRGDHSDFLRNRLLGCGSCSSVDSTASCGVIAGV